MSRATFTGIDRALTSGTTFRLSSSSINGRPENPEQYCSISEIFMPVVLRSGLPTPNTLRDARQASSMFHHFSISNISNARDIVSTHRL
ncbi:MAG: phosphatidylinositol 4-kinase [Caudoviricetes sp.]|nr:MAG: phosphatidylinositol 4-kinase [Caudoviricetes sp.]